MSYIIGNVEVPDFSTALRLATRPNLTKARPASSSARLAPAPLRTVAPVTMPSKTLAPAPVKTLAPAPAKTVIAPPTVQVKPGTPDPSQAEKKPISWAMVALFAGLAVGGALLFLSRRK